MIGKVIEGRYAGGSVHRVPDKNSFYIQTEDGDTIALSKKNAISVTDATNQYPSYGTKVMKVTWNDSAISIFFLGAAKVTSQPTQQQPERHVAECSIESNTDASYQNKNNTAMKRLTCEMCGSNDLLKQDGVFVCQHCGCKYSVEEARRMMVEGTVKIDNSDKLMNLYSAARTAKEVGNYEQAQSFYSEILALEPNSWEAVYYSVFCVVANCRIYQIHSSANALSACFQKAISLIDDYAADKEEAIIRITTDTMALAGTMQKSALRTLNDLAKWGCSNFTSLLGDYLERTYAIAELLFSVGDSIENNSSKLAIVSWDQGICYVNNFVAFYDRGSQQEQGMYNKIRKYTDKIRKYSEHYSDPVADHSMYNDFINQVLARSGKQSTPKTTNSDSGGCYIATAVYGSYNCPQVWTLRRFRDYKLAESWYGRAFIRTYYAISPTIVKWFGNTTWFKKIWKGTLDRMVSSLNSKGVADTPYEDRNW